MDRLINKPVFRLCNDWVFKEVFSKVPNALASLISVTLDIDYLLEVVLLINKEQENYGKINYGQGEKVLLEFVSVSFLKDIGQ